ncbi:MULTISPECIES: outer membrane beta-barrel protein [unclassified Helicobacter]|uniref:outer membrane beta-barrel protein n=1 Tax=unclassified Helicobacter TaxID=2593540 RepID=UPI000CF0F545|nr:MULTISPECIES: outer membrane beta-barrel protein [unclassified Helicobacter]
MKKNILIILLLISIPISQIYAQSKPDQYSKNGYILGFELSGGFGKGNGSTREMILATPGSDFTISLFDFKPIQFDGKIFFGYQHFFGESQKVGFDIKGIFGAGYLHMLRKNNANILYPANIVAEGDSKITLITDYIPLTFGVETNLLFNIFEKNKHAFGFNVGGGYSFVYAINSLIKIPNMEEYSPVFPQIYNSFFKQFSNKNISYSLLYPKVGFYYFFDKHQISWGFSFNKVFGKSKNNNSFFDTRGEGKKNMSIETKLDYFYSFNVSYAYRF